MFEEIMDRIDVTKYSYRKLMLVPLIILIIALLLLSTNYLRLGRPLNYGMELEGGTTAYIQNVTLDIKVLEDDLQKNFSDSEITVRKSGTEYRVEAPASIDSVELKDFIVSKYPNAKVSIQYMGPTLGSDLRTQAIRALIYAFIGMAIVVFIVFRIPYPTIAVIFSASSDIVITAFLMYLLGIKLTLGTIAALLILIGYSVDSNILLTTKCLKRRGETNERIRNAMKTGLTMTSTTIAAMVVMFVVCIQTPILKDMAAVLTLGLVIDIMNTWMFNAGILKWYLLKESSKKKRFKAGGR
ncbi:MAG: protein translocase subunit SecF [Methanomicrobia archaeon]|nr:protein translocase subunit SecF [Methanomicrobia archaeon]RLF93919.1 MAG: preprotein translocase subunit SecF [Thermococci archaeon]